METNCTDTDMMKVLNRSLILTPYPDVGLENNTVGQYLQDSISIQ